MGNAAEVVGRASMILIPEIETVVILVPRTGTGSLRRTIEQCYPRSTLIYRHMEADGVPFGYDRWRRVGVVRNPVDRLWSLYKFIGAFDGHEEAYLAEQRRSVTLPFSEWLVRNQTVFTSPYDSAGLGRFWPQYTVRHPLPETRKSQFVYLRPDLGTQVFNFDDRARLYRLLDLPDDRHENATSPIPRPSLTRAAVDHIDRFFAWDWTALHETAEPA